MIQKITTVTILTSILALTGCTSTPSTPQYYVNKERNIEHIQRSFELYTQYKTHKAMAVAFDNEGKYVLGYSYDASSVESAKNIALQRCTQANQNAEVKANASCILYAVEDKIVTSLK